MCKRQTHLSSLTVKKVYFRKVCKLSSVQDKGECGKINIWAFNNPVPVFKGDFGLVTICCIVSVTEECKNMAHAVRSRRCWERARSTHQLFQEENYSPFEEIDEKQMRELTSSHTCLSLLMSIKACLFTLHSCYENLILRNRGQTCQALQGTDKSR